MIIRKYQDYLLNDETQHTLMTSSALTFQRYFCYCKLLHGKYLGK